MDMITFPRIFYALTIKSWLQFHRIISNAYFELGFVHNFLKLPKSYLSTNQEIKN